MYRKFLPVLGRLAVLDVSSLLRCAPLAAGALRALAVGAVFMLAPNNTSECPL